MERLTEKQRHILQQKLCDMKRRCYNPEEKFYKDYGGRGIKVCDEWMDKKEGHSNFQKWAVENGYLRKTAGNAYDLPLFKETTGYGRTRKRKTYERI